MSYSTKNRILRVFGRFHAFEEKKKRKNRKFENLVIFIFCTFSKISSRRQAKLITIYRIPGFSFFISFRFQCDTCFQYVISCFTKAYRNSFASSFWQVAVCGIHVWKSFTGHHILLLELISFQKFQPPKHWQRQTVNYLIRIQDFICCNFIVNFWYCLACCILYSKKSKETSMKRSVSTHVSLKYRQRIV